MTRRARAGCAGLLLIVGAASACRFERRTDLGADEPVAASPYLAPDHPTTPVEDSVRAAVVAVSDALGAADSAAVVGLTTPDAVLIDQEDGVRWTRAGGALPGTLAALDSTVAWAMEAVSFDLIGSGAALYSGVFTTPTANPPRSAVESWVVIRTDAGWRVRYLHRSRGQGQGAPLP